MVNAPVVDPVEMVVVAKVDVPRTLKRVLTDRLVVEALASVV